MKLFLTSQWLLPGFRGAFEALVGKSLGSVHVALIENGADDEKGEPRWVSNARNSLTEAGMHVTQVDLRRYAGRENYDDLQKVLSAADVIWIGGGNTFYLNWILHDSGAAEIIKKRVAGGAVYAGGSAGAIVAGPTIGGFEDADDVSFAPGLVLDGLHLTDVVVLPHWGRGDYGEIMQRIATHMENEGYKIQPLTDHEALVINGSESNVLS